MAHEYAFEKENTHISLHQSFKTDLFKIAQLWDNDGKQVATMFAKSLNEIANSLKPIKSYDDLKEFIKSAPLYSTRIKPKAYCDAGCSNSDALFFEYRLIEGENGWFYGRIGLFFPAMFKENKGNIEDLKIFCRDWETKMSDFNRAEIYFAVYSD